MAADQLSDIEDSLKRRARRRLVGSIALVLLMAAILPMLLDDRSQKSLPPEIIISIPSPNDTTFTSKVIPDSPPISETTDGDNASSTVIDKNPKAAVKPQREQKKSPPAENKKSSEKASLPNNKDSYSVQIGVFSDKLKVAQLSEQIAQYGIPCSTTKIDLSQEIKYRLRCGSYADSTAAQQALNKLKSAGHDGILVTDK